MNLIDTILSHLFPKYTRKIYRKGAIDEFNWQNRKR